MLDRGVYLAPSGYEVVFSSAALTDTDLDTVVAAAREAATRARGRPRDRAAAPRAHAPRTGRPAGSPCSAPSWRSCWRAVAVAGPVLRRTRSSCPDGREVGPADRARPLPAATLPVLGGDEDGRDGRAGRASRWSSTSGPSGASRARTRCPRSRPSTRPWATRCRFVGRRLRGPHAGRPGLRRRGRGDLRAASRTRTGRSSTRCRGARTPQTLLVDADGPDRLPPRGPADRAGPDRPDRRAPRHPSA